METHGWCHMFESNLQKTSIGSITQTVQKISKPKSIFEGQIKNTRKYVEAFRHVVSQSKKATENE